MEEIKKEIKGFVGLKEDLESVDKNFSLNSSNNKTSIKGFNQKANLVDFRDLFYAFLKSKEPEQATEAIVIEIKSKIEFKNVLREGGTEFYIFNNGIWIPNAKDEIEAICRTLIGTMYKRLFSEVTVAKIRADSTIFFHNIPELPIDIMPVKNGLLNTTTKTLSEFDSKYFFKNKIDCNFVDGKECPEFAKFLKSILPDEEDRIVIQEFFGYALLRDMPYHKFLYLVGGGSNGKNVLTTIISKVLGNKSVSSMTMQDLTEEQFAKAILENSMINIADENKGGFVKNFNQIKSLTGGGRVSANRKNQSYIEFSNRCKLVFQYNDFIRFNEDNYAVWRRILLVKFKQKFVTELEYKELSEEEQEGVSIADPQLTHRIISSNDEREGILNWMLEGLTRLSGNGHFSENKSSTEIRKEFLLKGDPYTAFIEECLVTGEPDGAPIFRDSLRKTYDIWAKENNILKRLNDKALFKNVRETFGIKDSFIRVGGVSKRCFESINYTNLWYNKTGTDTHDTHDTLVSPYFSRNISSRIQGQNSVSSVASVADKHKPYTNTLNTFNENSSLSNSPNINENDKPKCYTCQVETRDFSRNGRFYCVACYQAEFDFE